MRKEKILKNSVIKIHTKDNTQLWYCLHLYPVFHKGSSFFLTVTSCIPFFLLSFAIKKNKHTTVKNENKQGKKKKVADIYQVCSNVRPPKSIHDFMCTGAAMFGLGWLNFVVLYQVALHFLRQLFSPTKPGNWSTPDQLLTQILNGFSTEYFIEFLQQMIICIKER